jgi:diguanylate cyclase (GGDEF)-like protein
MEFKDIVDVPTWQRMQDSASAVLRVPVVTIDTAGRQMLVSGVIPAYSIMIENRSLMLASSRARELHDRMEPHTFQCQSGPHYALAPVYVNGNLLCAIVAGPMRFLEDMETQAIYVSKFTGLNSDDLIREIKSFPLSTNETLAASQAAVETLAKLLPESSMFRKEATRQIGSLRTLLDFSNQLGTQLEMNPLFITTINFCVKQLGAQDAAIWYHDVRMRFSSEDDRNSLCSVVEQRLLPQILGSNTVMHVPDARHDFTLSTIPHIEALPNSIVALPLHVDGKPEGMLVLYSSVGTVYESSLGVMQGVAQRLSASLEKAQSLRSAQENAVTDGLTGLQNKRYLMDSLKAEVARAKQFNRPTSLLIFDIDNFKSYNDTFGHPAGDSLLRDIGHLIRQNANQIDITCRYGGEEFVIVMPETNPEHAVLRAEKLRRSIANHPFDHRQCTVSLGLVVAMRSDVSPDTLIKEADKALYTSKKTGKNKVTTMIIVDNNIAPIAYDMPKIV